MGIDLYYFQASPPCMSVMVLAEALGIELNLKTVNRQAGDLMTPEFLKLNPQRTVPTLVDNGFNLWESRAIMQYLCDKYARSDKFYPKDPKQRAVVNRLLYFDIGTFYKALMDVFIARRNKLDDSEAKKKVYEALELMNEFLAGKKWLTGDQITIADISAFVTTSIVVMMGQTDLSPYPNVKKWLENAKKEMPGREVVEKGLQALKNFFQQMSSQQNA